MGSVLSVHRANHRWPQKINQQEMSFFWGKNRGTHSRQQTHSLDLSKARLVAGTGPCYLSLWRSSRPEAPPSRGYWGPTCPISEHSSRSSCSNPRNCGWAQTTVFLVSVKTFLDCFLLLCATTLEREIKMSIKNDDEKPQIPSSNLREAYSWVLLLHICWKGPSVATSYVIFFFFKASPRVKIPQKSCSRGKCCSIYAKNRAPWQSKAVVAVTSHNKFLALHSGVALGSLQQRYPVMHLLRRIRVTVEDPVGRDDHKRIGSGRQGRKEAKTLSSTSNITCLKQDQMPFSWRMVTGIENCSAVCIFMLRQLSLISARFIFCIINL